MLFQFSPGYFGNVFETLQQIGFVDVILPFVLIFTVIYAVVQKTKILGEGAKKFNIIFALVVALLSVFPHVTSPGSPYDIIPIVNNSLPQIGLVIIAILMVMLMTGLVGGKDKAVWESWAKYVMYIAIVAVVYIFGASAGWWQFIGISSYLSDPNLLALIVVIIVFGIVIAFVTSGDDKGRRGEGGSAEEAARGAAEGAAGRRS